MRWYADLQIEDLVDNRSSEIDTESKQLNLLFQQLSNSYDIELNSLSIAQGLKQVKDDNTLSCVSNAIKTPERLNYTVYSEPFQLTLSHQLIFLKNNKWVEAGIKNFIANGNVDLKSLVLNHRPMGVGVSQGRSYGKILDEIFESKEIFKRIYWRGAQEKTAGLFQMLRRGRLDYIVEYPDVINHLAKQVKGNQEVVGFPILNNKEYIVSYIACSNNSAGKTLVARIDEILKKLGKSKQYFDVMKTPYLRSSLSSFTKAYNEVFLPLSR